MAVQINEVIIRAVVDPKPTSGTGGANEPECPPSSDSSEAEMIEKVLAIIREKGER